MKKIYIPIVFLTFVNTLNFTVLIPVLPFIIQTYGGGPITYGIILSAYPFFQFFAAPLLGNLSDVYGRRPILLISQAGTVLSWVVFIMAYFLRNYSILGIALPLIMIFLSRGIDGVTGGNAAVSEAYLADVSKPQERTKVYGITGGVLGIALVIGPVLGSISNSFSIGFLGTALLTIVISGLGLLLMYLYVPESLGPEHRKRSIHFSITDEFKFFKKIRKFGKRIQSLFLLRAFFLFVFSGFTSIFIFFTIDEFGLNEQQVTYLFLLIGFFIMVNQAFLAPYFAKKLGELKSHIFGVVLVMVTQVLMVIVPNIWWFLPVIYLNNLGFSIYMPTFKTLITSAVKREEQGEINGIDQSVWAASSALAPLTAGILYAHMKQYMFIVYSFILVYALFLFRKYFRQWLAQVS
ncbi:MFS transporter [Candidatus Woesebacteria bacterium]|nr:MFS transporter [Candidatus Woesebacteria bacterium]